MEGAYRGKTPTELVGTKNSHFTVLPISDFNNNLHFVTVIIVTEKLNSAWVHGYNIFSDWTDVEEFGPGKKYSRL